MDPSTYNAFQNLLHHPFFIIFIIFFFPLLLLHSTTKPKKLHLPPGPKPWPILGNIPQLLKSKSPHITFSQFAQSHGPLISLKLGSQIMIIASSPMSASQILRTHELLTAGTDTTTTTIEWAMAELLMNKEALTRVREECIKETLRLHPPAPFLIPHRAQETCNVMNYTIPKNSQIIINVWAISRDPSVWVDPLSFKPERFLDGSTRADFKGRDFEFLPFGSGRRMCPGLPVAVRQLPLILASLVRGFDWSLPVGQDLDMREKFGLTLHKDQPLVLVVDKQRT
ncbi:Geraniol 8-hydroxylase [Linum perenne]